MTLLTHAEANEFVPKKDPNCVFNIDFARVMLGFLTKATPGGLKITGPSGSGKSYLTRQFHAYTNRPLFSVTGYETLEFEDLIGTREIVDGDTHTNYGPLVQAASMGNATFLFEEIDRSKPSCNVGMNTALDGEPIVVTIEGGSRIAQQPGFRIMATANTEGDGDMTGDYNTATVMDFSTKRRFWNYKQWYVEPEVEFRILRQAVDPQYEDENLRASHRIRQRRALSARRTRF